MDTSQGEGDGLRLPEAVVGVPSLATQGLVVAVDQLTRLLPPLGRVGALTSGPGRVMRAQQLLARLRTLRQP